MAVDELLTAPLCADPRVGVVVLTHNRVAEVTRTLERLASLPERPMIMLVDNGSTDGTAETVRRRFPSVICIRLATNLGAAGRNAGIEACDRPYIALCDDDTWWEPGSLARAADLLDAHPTIAVITGKVLVRSLHIDPTCLAMANSPLPAPPGFPGTSLLGFLAGASIVRREAVLAVGGFEPRLFLGAEEELLTLDLVTAGWSLGYVNDLVVHHHPSQNRDVEGRRRLLKRNSLWIAWLRRPARSAIAQTLVMIRAAMHDRAARGALRELTAHFMWVLRNRRCISPALEHRLRTLERAHSESRADPHIRGALARSERHATGGAEHVTSREKRSLT